MDFPEDKPFFERVMPDGRQADVLLMLHGKARICVGPAGIKAYDDIY